MSPFALHAPLTNLAGWIFLAIRRPFVVGDRIQIGDHAGDVIDMRLFTFSLVEIGNWVADDIDFAYPTMRYYGNKGEGKPGRAPQSET